MKERSWTSACGSDQACRAGARTSARVRSARPVRSNLHAASSSAGDGASRRPAAALAAAGGDPVLRREHVRREHDLTLDGPEAWSALLRELAARRGGLVSAEALRPA
ncbi:hypothetical protein WMF18_06820 [Sorangium sp. So ce315]|uniref:hypothetical protein n=1 Tax=Sorangium sp. So ce315 TaxID=3133299 RepID=UPI003F5E6A13